MSKWADLKVRTISALVMVAGFIFIMEIHPYAFFGLLAIAYPIMLKEWFGLVWKQQNRWGWSAFGLIYITMAIGSLILIYSFYDSDSSSIYKLVVLVAAIDIGGYIFGKLFGKTKLAPDISPGKTWEGLLGSAICASVLSYTIAPSFWDSIFLGVIPAVIATIGDLLESFVKRRAGMKDSGKLIPGHGGLLDRVDGLMACAIYFGPIMLAPHGLLLLVE